MLASFHSNTLCILLCIVLVCILVCCTVIYIISTHFICDNCERMLPLCVVLPERHLEGEWGVVGEHLDTYEQFTEFLKSDKENSVST